MRTPEQDLFERLQNVGTVKPTAPTAGSPVEQEMAKGDPDFSTPVTMRNLFTHHDSHPVVLDFALLKAFGDAWWHWEPETIWSEVQHNFSTQISELSRSKIRTVQTIHVTRMPWEKWQVFEKVGQGLNNNIPNFHLAQPLTLEQLFAAVDVLDILRHETYSNEVRLYMAACVLNEDVFFVPQPLDFIQVEVSQPHYRCRDCDHTESALFHDGVCSHCSERLHPEQGLSLKPRNERGRNVETIIKYDPTPIARHWAENKDKSLSHWLTSYDPADETNVQCLKLFLARDYMNLRRKQLAEQLTTLKAWLGAS